MAKSMTIRMGRYIVPDYRSRLLANIVRHGATLVELHRLFEES